MSEFLNPKSMITPGVAGGVMMFLVNGLAVPFPELPVRYLALALSFVLGALVVVRASKMKVPERLVYWVLNSLVIFVVGFGANNLGREATGASSERTTDHAALSLLIPSAYAQQQKTTTPAPAETGKQPASAPAAKTPEDETKKLQAEVQALLKENAELKKATAKDSKKRNGSFFKRW